MILEKYSIGIGDRFAHQGKAQLDALIKAKKQGVFIVPVWNKSYREHTIIKSVPGDTRNEADEAVNARGWKEAYYVDADHIGLKNVDDFLESSNFFTLDVADFILETPDEQDLQEFIKKQDKYIGTLDIPGIDESFQVTSEMLEKTAHKFLYAIKEAGKIYRHIESVKGKDAFVTEVSVDESNEPQTPAELFFILSAVAEEGIPAQTIAPKFTGRFNKGVDYVGDLHQFTKEFEEDIAVINFAIKEFSLPANLKLSVHSGSDKFSIYPPIRKSLQKFDIGLHLKTAGTTWLEELIGLAMAGGDGLDIAKEIYKKAFFRFEELCKPYAAVIDINKERLPSPETVDRWSEETYASTLRHNQKCELYNSNFRQLLHIGYKIAAEIGSRYLDGLIKHENVISQNVTENIYERHLKPIFIWE